MRECVCERACGVCQCVRVGRCVSGCDGGCGSVSECACVSKRAALVQPPLLGHLVLQLAYGKG